MIREVRSLKFLKSKTVQKESAEQQLSPRKDGGCRSLSTLNRYKLDFSSKTVVCEYQKADCEENKFFYSFQCWLHSPLSLIWRFFIYRLSSVYVGCRLMMLTQVALSILVKTTKRLKDHKFSSIILFLRTFGGANCNLYFDLYWVNRLHMQTPAYLYVTAFHLHLLQYV